MLFKIGENDYSDYVSEMKVGYRTLLANTEQNANGDTFIDVLNHKYTVQITVKPMLDRIEMQGLLSSLGDSNLITFFDPKTGLNATGIVCTVDTPEPEIYSFINELPLYKKLKLTFTQM